MSSAQTGKSSRFPHAPKGLSAVRRSNIASREGRTRFVEVESDRWCLHDGINAANSDYLLLRHVDALN